MNVAVNQLTRAVTGKDGLKACSVQELQQLCSTYPWFAAAQLLLIKKLQAEDSPLFEGALQRASLYFSNPLAFHFEMHSPARITENSIPRNYPEPAITPEQAAAVEPEVAGTNSEAPVAVSDDFIANTSGDEESDVAEAESTETAHEAYRTETDVSEDVPEPSPLSLISPLSGVENVGTGTSGDFVPSSENPLQIDERGSEPGEATERVPPVLPRHTVLEMPATVEELVDQTRWSPISGTTEAVESSDSQPELKIAPLRLEPVDLSAPALTFEPYHTVDYFASQGIKVKNDELPRDRFSQQLKSFTEWLKTMKKVPAGELQQGAALPEEKKVEQMAEVSLSDRDVVTEAMAEVWEKQGNVVRATDVYRKLSLINPSKSAYFAAKIEHLNKQFS